MPSSRFLAVAASLPFVSGLAAQDPSRRSSLDRATRDLPAQAAPSLGTQTGPLRLLDVSLDIVGALGASSERNAVLRDLQGGQHDPKQRGFTLQQAELSLAAAIDPYLRGESHMVALIDPDGETIFELEEAFLTTQQLPWDLQVKAGQFLTEFGRVNQQHSHQWDWQDQPAIHTRLFGGDGMRGPGARVSWLVPGDTYGELFLGVQNANGETMPSFLANEEVYEERPLGGRLFADRDVRSGSEVVWSGRAVTSFGVSTFGTVLLGTSALLGPNATGGDGDTLIWGADFIWRWRPDTHRRGYPFWKVQGEFLARAFDAVDQVDTSDPLNPVAVPGDTLRDHGGYLQVVHGFAEGWAAGLRVDWASGSGANYDADTQALVARDADPFRADRLRIAPMLAFAPTEFSRFRLQYNYDDSDHLDDPVHSVWFGFEVLMGAHPPHSY